MKYFIPGMAEDNGLCMVDWLTFSNGFETEKGASLASQWPADARIQVISPSLAPGMVLGNYENILLVNETLKKLLEKKCKDVSMEFLPFSVIDKKKKVIGENYFMINPLGTYDALDYLASDIQWNSDGNISAIKEIILCERKTAAAPSLFRLQHAPECIMLNHDLATAIYDLEPALLYSEQTFSDAEKMADAGHLPENITLEQVSLSVQLVKAVKNGKTALVESLLAKQPLLIVFDRRASGATALMYAAQQGDSQLVKKLIDAGAALNIADNENRTALYFALQENKVTCVKELLHAGANPNICRQDNGEIIDSPLERAVYMNFRPIVQLLLAHKADPNLTDKNGKIPFHSVAAGDEEMYRWLLEAGTDVNPNSKDFSPPFHMLAGHASLDLLKTAMEKGANINSRDGYTQSTALMEAAANGKLENVKFLMSRQADPKLKDIDGNTAVQLAFENKHYPVVEYLASAGVSVEEKILKQIKKLQKARTEFAFDLYAQSVADQIVHIIQKNKKAIKFKAGRLVADFDKHWQLESFSFSGESDFSYQISIDDAIPAGYDEGTIKKLFAPLLKKFKLQEQSVSPAPILYWQLYKAIHQQLPVIGIELKELMITHTSGNRYYNFSSLHNSVRTSLSLLMEKPDLLKEYAATCLNSKTEQQALQQLFGTASNTYAMDGFAASIVASAVTQVLKAKKKIKEPVKRITVQYIDHGSILPSCIRLEFQKGAAQSWYLDIPESTIPDHADHVHVQDHLLPAFIKKHGLKAAAFEWGDLHQLPSCLLRLEFLLAGQQILQQLKEQGIPLTPKASAYIGDGEDDCDDLPGYTKQVQKEIRAKLADGKILKAFAELCFQTKEKQQWLQGLQ